MVKIIFNGKPLDFYFIREKLKALPLSLEPFKQQMSAVILFGSLAKGMETPLSDVDLAVLYDKNLNDAELEKLHGQVYEIISDLLTTDSIDLINLNTAPLPMRYGAIRQAKILILNNRDAYVDFWEHTVKQYLDFKPLLDECNKTLLDTLARRTLHG